MMCADETTEGTEKLKDLGLKELATRWLFSQGVSTILLFAILIRYPQMIEQQEAERKQARTEYREMLKEQQVLFKETATELKNAIQENNRK